MSTAPLGHSPVAAPLCFILLRPATLILYLGLLVFFFFYYYHYYEEMVKTAGDDGGESLVSFHHVADRHGGLQGRSTRSIRGREREFGF